MKKTSKIAIGILAENDRIKKLYCKKCPDFDVCKLNRKDCLKSNHKVKHSESNS